MHELSRVNSFVVTARHSKCVIKRKDVLWKFPPVCNQTIVTDKCIWKYTTLSKVAKWNGKFESHLSLCNLNWNSTHFFPTISISKMNSRVGIDSHFSLLSIFKLKFNTFIQLSYLWKMENETTFKKSFSALEESELSESDSEMRIKES